jgi:threonine dehydrogenase-like Zn-dependent dehydrogenase
MTQCINLLDRYGELVINGYWKHPQLLDVHHAFSRELRSTARRLDAPRLLDTLELMRQGKLRVAPTITQRFKARDFGKATALMNSNSADYLGVLIEWEE